MANETFSPTGAEDGGDTPEQPHAYADPHAELLRQPPPGTRLFKIMAVEHLLGSVEGGYLHFNRVDRYTEFPGADADDGAQLPGDVAGNAAITFEKASDFSVSDYYKTSRQRSYACCFSASNSAHIWEHYGNTGGKGKVALVINAGKLRARLNATVTGTASALMLGEARCRQIFSINSEMIEYVDRRTHRENTGALPNPIRYTFLKDQSFEGENEYRVSLTAFGMGRFRLADGSELPFPASLQLAFNFHDAMEDGTIEAILISPDVDVDNLQAALRALGFNAILQQPWDNSPASPRVVTQRIEADDSGQSPAPNRESGSL